MKINKIDLLMVYLYDKINKVKVLEVFNMENVVFEKNNVSYSNNNSCDIFS